ncbi:MAG: MFS transporter [Zetaproteobacteria bacterium]|nr:MFS transporter [Pseudobdellovibrionaceae bacterium]
MSNPRPETPTKSWLEALKDFTKPSVITMLFLGLSAGIPILLIFSSLSLWLREAGVTRSAVTFFSWAALGYSFKFVWAPLVDRLPLPFLHKKMGRRRSWILLSQIAIILSILGMAFTDPASSESALVMMAISTVLLGFSSATQDIVIDAYRIESDSSDMQALLSSTYIAGYRIGMIIAGAGALFLASSLGTKMGSYDYHAWKWTYVVMALSMLIGVATTLIIKEPAEKRKASEYTTKDYSQFFMLFLVIVTCFIAVFFISSDLMKGLREPTHALLGKGLGSFILALCRLAIALAFSAFGAKLMVTAGFVNKAMVNDTYIEPIKDFFTRYGTSTAILLLTLVGLYRVSDIVLGVISNVFYQDLGFTKVEIAAIVKTFGLFMTLAGGFLGGLLTTRVGVMKILFLGAVLSAATNLLFIALAHMGNDMTMLYVVISADNLSAGLASAAFIAFLSSLTNISFTAIQYAIFSSLMTLFPKILGGYSGSMVENLGYQNFFLTTTLMGIPVLYVIWLAGKKLEIKK